MGSQAGVCVMYQLERSDIVATQDGFSRGRHRLRLGRPTVANYLRQAETVYGLPIERILGPRQDAHTVRARHWVMYHAYNNGRCSLPDLGRRLGGLDHSTVIHGIRAHTIRHRLDMVLRPAPPTKRRSFAFEGPEPTEAAPFNLVALKARLRAHRAAGTHLELVGVAA